MRAVVLEAVYRCDWREMSVCERLKRLKKPAKISSLVCPRSLAPATVDVWRHAFFEALSSSAQKVLQRHGVATVHAAPVLPYLSTHPSPSQDSLDRSGTALRIAVAAPVLSLPSGGRPQAFRRPALASRDCSRRGKHRTAVAICLQAAFTVLSTSALLNSTHTKKQRASCSNVTELLLLRKPPYDCAAPKSANPPQRPLQ